MRINEDFSITDIGIKINLILGFEMVCTFLKSNCVCISSLFFRYYCNSEILALLMIWLLLTKWTVG